MPLTLLMLTIEPPSPCCIQWLARCEQKIGASRFNATMRSVKRGLAVVVSAGGPPPALFTSTSMLPSCSTTASMSANAASPSRMSPARNVQSAGRSSTGLRAQTATVAPASANRAAMPRPTPLVPPVTSTTLPVRSSSMVMTSSSSTVSSSSAGCGSRPTTMPCMPEPARGDDVAFEVVEEHARDRVGDAELLERGVVDRGVGLAHADLARVDHRVEQLVDRDHPAPRAAVLGDVVGDDRGADAPCPHRSHVLDDDRAVVGIVGHPAEQLAGVEADPRVGGVRGDLRERLAQAELTPLALVPRMVGVGVVRAEHELHQLVGGRRPARRRTCRWPGTASP